MVDAVVGQNEGQQYTDRDDGARDGIAKGGELDQAIEGASAFQAAGVAQEQGQARDDDRGGSGEGEAVGGIAEETRVDQGRAGVPGELRQVDRRHDETQHDRQAAGQRRGGGQPARELGGIAAVTQVGGDMEAGTATRMTFDQNQQCGDGDQHQRDLRGALAVSQTVPGPVDRGREGLHAVILDSAEVSERFEQRQRHASGDGGARERQSDAEKGSPRAVAENAAGLDQGQRLRQEGRACRQVDVGIEHQGEQQGHAAC